MKRLLYILLLVVFSAQVGAQVSPSWLRYSAISPDGSTIAFCYQGNLYTVAAEGGKAIQLTTQSSYDFRPIWSPDGKQIAFSSNRMGSFDVFIVSKEGGTVTRITTHSANEFVETFIDNDYLLYRSSVQPEAEDGQFPSATYSQVYKMSTKGGRPELFSSLTMEDISINGKGEILYHDKKGYEDYWRKHQVSAIARDVWMTQLDGERSYKKITTFRGEDRNPVWAPDGKSFYYLSESDGTFNVYKSDAINFAPKQVTSFKKNPVRFLSIANNETLCFGQDGDIYIQKVNGQPKKVNITIVSDLDQPDLRRQTLSNGASAMAVSESGKEVAFVARGEVYVTSFDYETTKRITNTVEQERNVDFAPDGRSVVYSSERNGVWGIYQSSIVRESDKQFAYAQEIKEEPLLVGKEACFQPVYSPDGEEIAYLANRTELRVYNLKSKKSRTVLDAKFNYSYTDGDVSFQWSPDSKWLLTSYIGIGGWNNKDVALVKADGSGELTNLTESGYSDSNPRWVLGGKAMIWRSDRAGYRSHGSWGSQGDVYIMFFDAATYDKFNLNKEELALLEEVEKTEKEKAEKAEQEKKDKDKDKDKKKEDEEKKDDKKVEALVFDLENRKDRIIRLTINSSNLGDAVLTKDGSKLYYLSAFEGGYDLWERDFKENSTKIVHKGIGGGRIDTDKELKNMYMIVGDMKRIEFDGLKITNIAFRADFDYKPISERSYIYEHAWNLVKNKFYVKDIHGVDWDGYRAVYSKFLPHISNNFDFAEMLGEMLGELNASHTGARYSAPGAAYATASLGAFFDESHNDNGLKIKEVIKQGPLTKAATKIKAGSIIEKIDGVEIKKGEDYYPLLDGKAGRRTLLTIYNPDTKERFEEQVKPISYGQQGELLYKRWVAQRAEMTEKLSNGKIGYVHIKGMNSESFREVYSEVLGKYRNKEAILIDTRHNGGGWLHNDLAILFSGKEYQRYEPRGQYIGSDPFTQWNKPSAMLVCEDNYSNAHGTPFMYKELKLGKLIGTPVAGTMTAVWWEGQVDPSIVFGVPQTAVKDMRGNYLENQELQPDIEVYNEPASQLKGKDEQLEAAVAALLKDIKK